MGYLINSRGVFPMVESWDQNRESLDMVHADIKLILQHPSSLITHASEHLLALFGSLRAHTTEDPNRSQGPTNYPWKQELSPPILANFLGTNILVVQMVDLEAIVWDFIPTFEPHLATTITKETSLGVLKFTINGPVHWNRRCYPAT